MIKTSRIKNLMIAILSVLLFFSFAMIFLPSPKVGAAERDIRELVWTNTGTWTDGTENDAFKTGVGGTEKMQAYSLTPLSALTGRDTRSDYEVSVDIDVTEFNSDGRMEAGIIPFYTDENNYMVVNVAQENGQVKIITYGKLRGVETCMGGQPEDVSGAITAVDLTDSEKDHFTFTVRVEKVYENTTPASRLYFLINGQQLHTRGWAAANWRLPYDKSVQVGLALRNVTANYSAFTAKDYFAADEWHAIRFDQDALDSIGVWDFTDKTSVVGDTGKVENAKDRTFAAVLPQAIGQADSYTVSVRITPETVYMDNPSGNQIIVGFTPWFTDLDNAVSVLVWYDQNSGNTKLVTVGYVDGVAIEGHDTLLSDYSLVNDATVGKSFTLACEVTVNSISVKLNDKNVLTFAAPDGKQFIFGGDNIFATGVRVQQLKAAFTEMAVAAEESEPFTERTVQHNGVIWKLNGETGKEWTLGSDNGATLQVLRNNNNDNNEITTKTYALRPTPLDKIVGISMRMKISIAENFTDSGNNKIGFYPFYQDSDNYLFVNLSQWGDRPFANFSAVGVLNGRNIGGNNNFIEQNTESLTNTNIRNACSFWFGVDFYADRVEFRFGVSQEELASVKTTYTFAEPLDVGALAPEADTYIGFGGNSANAVFSDVTIADVDKPSVPSYTEQEKLVDGVVWKVNGAHSGDEWSFDNNGSVTLQADFVQDQDGGLDRLIDKTYAVRPTPAETAFGVRFTSQMDVIEAHSESGCTKFGIIPFYLNQDNYVLVKMSQWQDQLAAVINITGKIGGKDLVNAGGSPWFEGGASVAYDIRSAGTQIKLSVSIFEDQLYVYLGDTAAPSLTYEYLVRDDDGSVIAASFENQTDLSKVYVGFAGNQKKVAFSSFTFQSDSAVSDEIGDGWTTNNPFGWSVDVNKNMLKGSASGESSAYKKTDLRGGLVVSAKIKMSKSGVAEGTQGVLYKAGLTPFYKNSYNYISVWIQQYGNDAGARLVAKGMINGKPLIAANGAGYLEGDWYDTMTPVTKVTEFEMKCEVTERAVNVYINNEFATSLRTQSGIPFGENEDDLSYGTIIENGDVEFSSFEILDKDNIVSETEITVTVKTTGGILVTDATVSNGSQKFTNNGDGTYTLIVPVRSEVTITVEKAGYDKVVYAVESSAMYQPQLSRIIEIAEEEKFPIPEFDDVDSEKNNIGAIVGGCVGGVAIIAAAVVVAVVIRKKKGSGVSGVKKDKDQND